MNNRDKLIDLITEHKLERREVAKLVMVDLGTVDHWLLPVEAHAREAIPDMAIELLDIKLQKRSE